MALTVDKYVSWNGGEGTPLKYEVWVNGTVDLVNIRPSGQQFLGDVVLDVTVTIANHPNNSRNSFEAADFALLSFGDIDPFNDYPLQPGRTYYGATLLQPDNLPSNSVAFEFRGDTYRALGPNKVSLWAQGWGYTINSESSEGEWSRRITMTHTMTLTGDRNQSILNWTPSGAEPNNVQWFTQDTWYSVADFYNYIEFNANGGTGAPARLEIPIADPSFTIPAQEPVRKGWYFVGWNRNSQATTAEFLPGETYPNNMIGTTTLYAIWDYTYRPGAMLDEGTWTSHDRDSNLQGGKYMTHVGHADIMYDNEWVEMRTRANKIGLEHAPSELLNNQWESQALDGYGAEPHDIGY